MGQRNLNERKASRDRQESEAGWRSFIAVDLSGEIRQAVAAVQNELRRATKDVRWVASHGIHLTLKFLGDIDPAFVETIAARMHEAVDGIRPFPVTIRGIGGFPNLRNPRVLWVGVQDQSEFLHTVHTRLEQGLMGVGFEPENRPFHPHLTLGRVKIRQVRGPFSELAETMKNRYLGDLTIDEIILFRSQLKPSGAEYTKLAAVPLKKTLR